MPLHIGKGRTVGTAIETIIDYVANPEKTDSGRLITSWQCDSRVADREFLFSKQQYYLLMDAYGNVGFSTSLEKPQRMERAELYKWLVEELTAIEPDLAEPRVKTGSDADYGRVDKAACWMLLSRLYLNAEVYSGKAEWQKAKDYAKKVMDSPYDINTTSVGRWSAYQLVFMGDNDRSAAAKEILFPIVNISGKTASYGNSLFLIAACLRRLQLRDTGCRT